MPNKQLGMEKIRQVLRCYSQGHGTKSISSMLSVSLQHGQEILTSIST